MPKILVAPSGKVWRCRCCGTEKADRYDFEKLGCYVSAVLADPSTPPAAPRTE